MAEEVQAARVDGQGEQLLGGQPSGGVLEALDGRVEDAVACPGVWVCGRAWVGWGTWWVAGRELAGERGMCVGGQMKRQRCTPAEGFQKGVGGVFTGGVMRAQPPKGQPTQPTHPTEVMRAPAMLCMPGRPGRGSLCSHPPNGSERSTPWKSMHATSLGCCSSGL